jgi:hypothetical protein
MPRDGVRDAPELLLDEEPFDVRPRIAAVLGCVQAAAELALQRLFFDRLERIGWKVAAVHLGLNLKRLKDLVGELARASLQLKLGVTEAKNVCGGWGVCACGHRRLIPVGD